jgi:hypothetical protein
MTPGLLLTVRDLLLSALTAREFKNLLFYSTHPDLRSLVHEIETGEGLASMVDKALVLCEKRDLVHVLLAEVRKANPRQYARFASRLAADAGTEAENDRARPSPAPHSRAGEVGRDQIFVGNISGSTVAIGAESNVDAGATLNLEEFVERLRGQQEDRGDEEADT